MPCFMRSLPWHWDWNHRYLKIMACSFLVLGLIILLPRVSGRWGLAMLWDAHMNLRTQIYVLKWFSMWIDVNVVSALFFSFFLCSWCGTIIWIIVDNLAMFVDRIIIMVIQSTKHGIDHNTCHLEIRLWYFSFRLHIGPCHNLCGHHGAINAQEKKLGMIFNCL